MVLSGNLTNKLERDLYLYVTIFVSQIVVLFWFCTLGAYVAYNEIQ